MESKVETAIHLFKNGYNCAQAVACAYADEVNADHDLVYKVAEGFGGGVPGHAGICGAASGMVIVAGLVYSDSDVTKKSKVTSYPKVNALQKKFCERLGAIECRALKLSKDQTMVGGKRAGCIECVREAARIIESDILNK